MTPSTRLTRAARRCGWFALFAALGFVVSGCRGTPPGPWTGQSLLVSWTVFPGGLLSAPEASPIDADLHVDPASCLRAEVVATSVDRDLGRNGRTPLIDRAEMIVGIDEATPINVTPDLLASSYLVEPTTGASGSSAGARAERITTIDGILHPAGTFVFALRETGALIDPDEERKVELRLTPDNEGGAEVALIVRGLPRIPLPGELDDVLDDDPVDATSNRTRREVAILYRHLAPGDPAMTLEVSPPFDGAKGRVIRLEVSLRPPPTRAGAEKEEHAQLVRGVEAELNEASEQLRRIAAHDRTRDPRTLQIEHALGALERSSLRRRALLQLCALAGAPIAGDLVLLGSREQIDTFVAKPLPKASQFAALRWTLESRAILYLVENAELGEATMPTDSILGRRCGALLRYPGMVRGLVRNASSPDEFQQLVTRENLLFLQDNRVSDRVRAYDWLVGLGKAPSGYDPLADKSERREALSQFEAASRPEPSPGSPTP